MNYCVDYAFANRKLIMERVIESFRINLVKNGMVTTMDVEPIINIAHNYAKMENHFGQNVMVHRKGATLASNDTIGIIPGSQGATSYIVRGLGNPDSFNSCSHGAGRIMGRKQAKQRLNLEYEINKLNEMGVLHDMRNVDSLDEAPGAYKNIITVMENQKDLVNIFVELTPLAVLKG